jgi:hypothetical protein
MSKLQRNFYSPKRMPASWLFLEWQSHTKRFVVKLDQINPTTFEPCRTTVESAGGVAATRSSPGEDIATTYANISPKNIARLEALARHASSEIKDLALLILEVARVKPHKRRRWKFLEQNHPELFKRLKALYGGEIPDADLSSLDLDISATQHLARFRATRASALGGRPILVGRS